MSDPIRALGHPLHPMLAHAPLALLATTFVWDGLSLLTGEPVWRELARWNLALGLAAAVPAAAVGFIDYVRLPAGHAAEVTASRHMLFIFGALTAYGGSAAFRFTTIASPELDWPLALASALVGLLLLAIGGRLGGALVYTHGLGVDQRPCESTNSQPPDASSSSS